MAATEQPVNTYDFSGTGAPNDMPENPREEEQYLYKYFKARGPKKVKQEKEDDEGDSDVNINDKGDDSSENEDPELEAFANDLIKKEMKKMNAQNDALDDEDEGVLSELEDDEDGEEDIDEEAEKDIEDED
jgi:hypothetical protein